MNKLIIKGNLTKDIDVKTTSNGTLVGEYILLKIMQGFT